MPHQQHSKNCIRGICGRSIQRRIGQTICFPESFGGSTATLHLAFHYFRQQNWSRWLQKPGGGTEGQHHAARRRPGEYALPTLPVCRNDLFLPCGWPNPEMNLGANKHLQLAFLMVQLGQNHMHQKQIRVSIYAHNEYFI